MWEEHRGEVSFFVIYIREAHAIDSPWPMTSADLPMVEEPLNPLERRAVAASCMTRLALEPIPALVDDMANSVDRAYEAWPDRLVLIDRDGRVAYRSAPGPFGFKPDELEQAILRETAGP